MFSLFRKKKAEPVNEVEQMVRDLVESSTKHPYFSKVITHEPYKKIQEASPELKLEIILELIKVLRSGSLRSDRHMARWTVYRTLTDLLLFKLDYKESHFLALLDWSIHEDRNFYRGIPVILKTINRYSKENTLSPAIREKLARLAEVASNEAHTSDEQRQIKKLRDAAGAVVSALPIVPGESWAQAALNDIQQLAADQQAAWGALLEECQLASGSSPSGKWLKGVEKHLAVIGLAEFKAAVLRWFPLVDKSPLPPLERKNMWGPDPNQVINVVNSDLLKGLAWVCGKSADPELARALQVLAISCYRKVPGYGPRAAKVGNACIWALGNMPGMEGLAQLSILKIKLRQSRAQALINTSVETAAQRNGLPADEVAELCVPTYGLDEVGQRFDELGELQSKIVVNGSEVEQSFVRGDGKRLASLPKVVQEENEEELKDIKQAVKDLRKMLPAQKDRIENLYLEQKKWQLPTWRERYLDHPLVGAIARRLIWKFSMDDRAGSGIWLDGQIVGRDGQPLDWLNDDTTVELWHPIYVDPGVIVEWRRWLVDHEIRQPFKQAHREIYILTDAEIATRHYSNRFAGHILKQHQFNALCQARGWKNSLRLMVDAEVPPPTRHLQQWDLRAEFWIEPCGDDYGTDTNDAGTYYYISTDQVRFYRLHQPENSAHAGGGGYHTARWVSPVDPVTLDNIPPLVFSEIMRDADLFVGVASVGNDPNWIDGGPEGRYTEYWQRYSFGDLSATAETRKAVLESLLPRLKISPRCRLADKFLEVRGDIRTYKIHLGSSNILMEPNDQYLCIVPARGGASSGERVFLPFEGDAVLAQILSKAFLLAEDRKIADPTIVAQIKRK